MSKNRYRTVSNTAVQVIVNQMISTMTPSPTTYGTSTTQLGTLGTLNANLAGEVESAENAKLALKVAMDAQEAARSAINDQIAIMAKQMYAKTGLSDAQIAATGLEPRDHVRTIHNPITPSQFAATPNADGTVLFEWARNGNPYGVVFVLEASVEGGPWNAVFSTKRARVTVGGFAPGLETATRVRATNRGLASLPSFEQVLYPTSAPQSSNLQIAA